MMNVAVKLIRQLRAMKKRHYNARKKLQCQFEVEIETAYKTRFPRRIYSLLRSFKENQPFHKETYNKYGLKVKNLIKTQDTQEKDRIREIEKACQYSKIPITKNLHKHHTSYASTYWTQGFGACKYARESAEDILNHAKDHGLRGEIRVVNSHIVKSGYPHLNLPNQHSADYEVWLNTSEGGFEILQKKKVSLLEWAIQCWRRGVNPKVYNPFLPDSIFDKSLSMR